MSKSNEDSDPISTANQIEESGKKRIAESTKEESLEREGLKSTGKGEDDKKEILKFTMLINKYNSDLGLKRTWRRGDDQDRHKKDVKCTMFFNKEVTIRPSVELPPPPLMVKSLEPSSKTTEINSKQSFPTKSNRSKTTETFESFRKPVDFQYCKLQISESDVISSKAYAPSGSSSSVFERTKLKSAKIRGGEIKNLKKFLIGAKSSKMENDSVGPAVNQNLRIHNSLTSLSKNIKSGLRGVLKSKIPSLTAIETANPVGAAAPTISAAKATQAKLGYFESDSDGFDQQSDGNKRWQLQISKSSSENSRRSVTKFKKDEAASVSDSKLLYADFEMKKQFKKCDKKSRGDSVKKETDVAGGGTGSGGGGGGGARKQVQWKTEVDVIYFSTQQAANGDRIGEVIGRVIEPLREEWEQQRKGFYAKLVSYHMESHLKDHFISLLKI